MSRNEEPEDAGLVLALVDRGGFGIGSLRFESLLLPPSSSTLAINSH